MKVTVRGIGAIPGIGTLAPQYGLDLNRDQIRKILSNKNFRVVDENTRTVVTYLNLDKLFNQKTPPHIQQHVTINPTPKTPTAPPIVEPVVIVDNSMDDAPSGEITTPIVEEEIVETPAVEAEENSHVEIIGNMPDALFEYEDEVITIETPGETTEEDTTKNQKRRNKKNRRH